MGTKTTYVIKMPWFKRSVAVSQREGLPPALTVVTSLGVSSDVYIDDVSFFYLHLVITTYLNNDPRKL